MQNRQAVIPYYVVRLKFCYIGTNRQVSITMIITIMSMHFQCLSQIYTRQMDSCHQKKYNIVFFAKDTKKQLKQKNALQNKGLK